MEIEFFCHPDSSQQWYRYWRDRRLHGIMVIWGFRANACNCEHHADELSHYSTVRQILSTPFSFLPAGEFWRTGSVRPIVVDLICEATHGREALIQNTRPLQLELGADGKPKHRQRQARI
ncbi:MAG: hypothetical protein U0894_16565 [Pirellulales bacterium]